MVAKSRMTVAKSHITVAKSRMTVAKSQVTVANSRMTVSRWPVPVSNSRLTVTRRPLLVTHAVMVCAHAQSRLTRGGSMKLNCHRPSVRHLGSGRGPTLSRTMGTLASHLTGVHRVGDARHAGDAGRGARRRRCGQRHRFSSARRSNPPLQRSSPSLGASREFAIRLEGAALMDQSTRPPWVSCLLDPLAGSVDHRYS